MVPKELKIQGSFKEFEELQYKKNKYFMVLVVRNITYLRDADVKGKRLKIARGNRTKAIYLINQFSLDAANSWSGQALLLVN